MNREYHKWHSPVLDRTMELLVFGSGGRRVLVFPSRRQRFFEYEDEGMVHSLRHAVAGGELQLFCVDSLDDEILYALERPAAERIARHRQWERYLLEEVLPFAEKLNPRKPWTAHGCSFGAYHAVTIALRYPRKFQRAVAFSGRYDLTLEVGDFHTLFHGFDAPELHDIMPSSFVPRLTDEKQLRSLRRQRFTLVVGEEDPFYQNNVELAGAFAAQQIKHALHVWCGNAHRFRYWRQMARLYL